MSMKSKMLSTLKEGSEVSGKQFAARFGTSVSSVASRVSELRREGYAIYNNRKTDTKGRVTYKYRLGTPTRKVVAAGYRAIDAMAATGS